MELALILRDVDGLKVIGTALVRLSSEI